MPGESKPHIVRDAERIFWIGCGVGFVWGALIGGTFALWVTA